MLINYHSFTSLDDSNLIKINTDTKVGKVGQSEGTVRLRCLECTKYPLRLPDSSTTNHGTQEVLNRIREVISDMDTSAWLPSVPRNYGLAAAGTLKADEWRTMATVYFPIALISMWGEGSVHRSEEVSKSARLLLDHFNDLEVSRAIASDGAVKIHFLAETDKRAHRDIGKA
ncbi:hypothetical protein HYPSUDRAFT_202492 [Hypholoma sublateritium FD-334 SS-4]|uniref:Uncharacterized protein n=1 Tax=Hypholoma sublateritium (strain FD-334 SS-4) TaxID=945553 RepID=A0A0D2MEH4_HYPSF|nr:hypothetical protein HYPSUDRAFT_202492 [Hypholoma sublateritium FD-334 SS-4]